MNKTVKQMELADAIFNMGNGGTIDIDADAADILAAFRILKAGKTPLRTMLRIPTTGYKGRNIHKANITDGKAMAKVFAPFVSSYNEKLLKPGFDYGGNGISASDGRMMLVCRIPRGLSEEDALGNGFVRPIYRWDTVAGDMCHDSYTLSNYQLMVDVEKGSAIHGLIRAYADFARAYHHLDEDKCDRHLMMVIGGKYYNPIFVADLVDGLFRLGNTVVKICEKTDMYGRITNGPLNLFGMNAQMDSKGLVMPFRAYDDTCGLILPLDKTATAAA